MLRGPAGLILALLGGGASLYGAGTKRAASAHPQAPDLFDSAQECGATLSPLHRANELEARALARIQRYPFASIEGVRAAALLSEAEHCFARAQKPEDARRVHAESQAWQRRLARDYAGHQLRLHHALINAQVPDAAAESRALLALLTGQEGPYVSWLRHIERGAP